jgi:LAS superfamily LD-carboxypeptidase LdcB
MLRTLGSGVLTLCAISLLAACNHAKSPTEVAKDVSSAAQTAEQHDSKAMENAEAKVGDAQKDVRSEQRDEQHVAAVQAQNVAETEADGARKVALAKCESLSGDRQRVCKDQANADYDLRVAQAKQQRAETDPKQ